MVGWIAIDGTGINYPVMQTLDNPEFYLKHNFEKEPSNYGVPFVDAKCDVLYPGDNTLVYGHHMKNGTMFSPLENYKSKTFWQEHRYIRFDTLAGFGTYEIIAAFKVHPDDFRYNRLPRKLNPVFCVDYTANQRHS
jgi:sortase B